jgi:hypothetical protein
LVERKREATMNVLTLQEIPRVKAGLAAKLETKDLDEIGQERLYLATRAKDLLGYTALVSDVTGEVVVGKREGKLTEALCTLDIEVLDTGTVIDYQISKAIEETREYAKTHLRDYATGYFSFATWSKTELGQYTQAIPEFVLDKAIRIKEAIPEVRFHVQHMSNPKADPFLVASLPGYDQEIYYIEAWDEPRFEGRVGR